MLLFRRIVLAFVLLAMSLVVSGQALKDHRMEVARNMDLFCSLYRSLDLMYVDTLDAEELITSGITAMLRRLDPYTEYYPESRQGDLRMMLTGKYAGIGAIVRFHQRRKYTVIDEPYEGMPAAEAGLRKGDVILEIDDSTMAGKPVAYVSERLRGDAGSTFRLKAWRPSTGDTLDLRIKRKSIKLPVIPYYGIIGDGIGYIGFSQFTEGSAKMMRRSLIDLKKLGAEKIILDLRSNGGGQLREAIDILSLWLPKGEKMVETKGKLRQANMEYTTRLEPVDTLMPLVVLVDGETASASEITAGGLQDLDRAVVMGQRTYGKGLVQVPVDLPYNSSLKVTTSRYYIPSGRCIQALDYSHGVKHAADSLKGTFYTRGGRKVEGGGGIKPDVELRPDTLQEITLFLDRADTTEVMFDFETEYIATHDTIGAAREFRLSDEDFKELKRRVVENGITYNYLSGKLLDELEKAAKTEGYYEDAAEEMGELRKKLRHDMERDMDKAEEEIKTIVEQDIVAAYYFQEGTVENGLGRDPAIKAAIELLGDEERYKSLLGK